MNALSIALRTAVSAAFLLSSLWALLAYVPFTYQQVHKGGLIPALNMFGRAYPSIFWIALLAVAVMFMVEPLPESPRRRTAMKLRATFWYIHIPFAIFQTLHPVFGTMENGVSSLVWAIAALEPLLYLSVIALWESWPAIRWGNHLAYGDPRLFMATCASAVFLSVIYGGLANWRAAQSWTLFQRTLAITSSLTAHLLVFSALFVVLNLLTAVASWFNNPRRTFFVFCYALGAWIVFSLMNMLVFPTITFNGSAANTYAAALGITVAIFAAGISALIRRASPAPASQFTSPLKTLQWWKGALAAALLAAVALFLAIASSKNDWNHLFQKLTALAIWVATVRMFSVLVRRRVSHAPLYTGRFLILALALLPAQRALEAGERTLWARTGAHESFSRFLDSYAGFDPSFKLVHDSMSTVVVDPGFYQFLARNTNLPRSAQIQPTEINLAEGTEPVTEAPPHIFIFVVDSLRKDYLSPYNSNVDFTPNIEKFAKESVVMRNAFTRYGGTGLSEPSIWVGGAMIHKQYVTPFAPMNSLQKLVELHAYQGFVTRDSILQTVVTPWPKLKELDEKYETMDLDFCQSLTELASDLGAAQNGPVFAYTQPQNIHISVISRQGTQAIDNGRYNEFYPPYASRLRRMDGCFGGFVETLKARNLYDNSFIVFTADHGDSLGEEGRWGHAYTIFPEILRVPLIIHLPARWHKKYVANPDALAFNSDVTPSLYYLLGHRPIQNSDLYGKPLFAEHLQELNAYQRDHYLVASSYAAVYGILSDQGRFLYTADAVNLKDSWFDMSEAKPSARPVTSTMRIMYEKAIREKIANVSRQYKVPPR